MAKAIAVIDEAVAGLPALEKAPGENDRRGLITPSGPLDQMSVEALAG
jgi:hypothetical protein